MRVIDFDPANSDSTVVSGSNNIDVIKNIVAPFNSAVGSGHSPGLDDSGWLPNIPALTFSGSATYTHNATQYVFDERADVYDSIFSCTNSTWKEWTIFVVCQLQQVPAVEAGIVNLNQIMPATFPGSNTAIFCPLLFLYANASNFMATIYADNLGSSNAVTLGAVDTAPHILEASADGAGNFDGWLDGVHATGTSDVRPKTAGSFTVGAAWYTNVRAVLEQLNGKVARLVIFDKNLSIVERTHIRKQLSSIYGI